MIRTITHKHLKRQFDILETADDLTPLFTELKFSTLLLPIAYENNNVSFPLLQAAGKKYAPVFTDIHEYNKCNTKNENYIRCFSRANVVFGLLKPLVNPSFTPHLDF